MLSLILPKVSSEEIEIIKKRDQNLNSKKVLDHILDQKYLSDIDNFKKIYKLSTQVYDKIPLRFSGEKYTQHPLRMLKKSTELGFKNQTLSEIILAHDVLESLREYERYFSNPKLIEKRLQNLFLEEYSHIEKLTPPRDGTPKDVQLENILESSSPFSSISIYEPIKMKIPVILPVPLCVIAKIFDIHDNCYDQRRFKPNGILTKTKQIEQVREYMQKNNIFNLLKNGPQNYFHGFPTNLIPILNKLLNNAEENLLNIDYPQK